MIEIGFGVMRDGVPYGIWPIGILHAQKVVARLKSQAAYKSNDLRIVPVYVGHDVAIVPPVRDKPDKTAA